MELISKNGCRFKAEIEGYECEGVIYVKDTTVYLLQNKCDGDAPEPFPLELDFRYSWNVRQGTEEDLDRNDVKNLVLIESTSTFASLGNKKKLLLFL